MIEFKPFHITYTMEKPLEEAILNSFEAEIFKPLIKSIDIKDKYLVHNSIDILRLALLRGDIFYNKVTNTFFSKKQYGTKIFNSLKEISTKFNGKTGNFQIAFYNLPLSIQSTINNIEYNALLIQRSLNQAITNIIDSTLPTKDFSIFFRNSGSKFIQSFEKQYKDEFGTIPIISKNITEEIRERLNTNYSNNLNQYINDFTKEEVLKIRKMVEENALKGLRSSSLEDILIREYNISKNKAKFLARQETSLFMAALEEAEFKSVGVTKFKWHTSQDERVRTDHKILNNQIFSFDNLPIIDQRTGQRGLPGQAFGCRCVSSAIFD